MLLAIHRTPIPLDGAADPVIEAMVNLMPDYSAGRRLHDLYVNKVQSALPGNYSQLFGTGPAFRGVFFPGWRADPLLVLTQDSGLDDGWWREFSIAVLCQAIAELGSHIRGQMITAKINSAVATFNGAVRDRSARVYARVLAMTYDPLVALLRQVNPATARQQFHDSLLSNVLNRQLWYQAGVWTSPDWEMFNQYAKYIALGATDAEVDVLIGELVAAGLPVPPQVSQGVWRTYAEELRDKPTVDVDDIRSACSGPVTTGTWLTNTMGGPPSQMPNGNCYEFTANSQPGRIYRQLPGGSCFTANSEVLDGTGNPVPLRQLRRGDTVLTPDGTAKVAYVAQPLRAGRRLYRLTGGGPVFTATHPFVNAAPPDPSLAPPAVLAVDPGTLAWAVPTMSEDGIGPLEAGSTVLTRATGPDPSPRAVTVTGVEEVPGDPDDPYLYDVRLVSRSGARQEFWAGHGTDFYLVSPEYPILDQAGAAATTVVAIMEGLLRSEGPDRRGWPVWIVDAVDGYGTGVFHNALLEALASTPSFGGPAPKEPLPERIDRIYGNLGTVPAETGTVVASLFDGLMASVGQWLASLVALGWRTSLVLGGDVVAVTVFDVTLTPANTVPPDTSIQLAVTVSGRTVSDGTYMWDRRGRDNTRFHHYFDQLVHVDLATDDRPTDLYFAVSIHGSAVPSLSVNVPGAVGDSPHQLQSAPLRDCTGQVVGAIRFDTRRLGRDAASVELGQSGLWTEDTATAYADALGAAMVEPILSKLQELSPSRER